MMEQQRCNEQILIVGAGPVGLSAAVELTRRGFRPKIIDQAKGPAGESRAFGIHARTLEIFEPSGITPILLNQGNRVDRSVFHDDRGEYMRIDFSLTRQKYNFALMLPQSRTEQILAEHLRERGIKVQWNTSLSSLKAADGKVACSFGDRQGEFDFLIGCDGAHSTVRKANQIRFAGESYQHDWQLVDVQFADDRPSNEIRIKTLDAEALVYFPLAGDVGRFVYTGALGIMDLVRREVEVRDVLWQSNFRISHRIVERYHVGNVFLAGDAAHIHSPVGGRGMNLGIEDAATLAWLVERGQAERYTEMRLPLGKRVLRFTNRQTRQITSTNPFVRWMSRRVAPLMLKSSFIQRLAFRELSGANTPRPEWL